MNTMQAAVLEPVGNGEIALQGVAVDATLRGLLSEVIVTQTYENLEVTNIEAIYTFPLPLDAVLMELTLELNGEILRGEVKPKSEAEADYEDAIEEGDSAVLLTRVQPGLFSVNVGNLMAGEKAKLRFRYAQLHRWQGDSLRFHVPTTLAPRYGDPAAAGLREHEMPEQSLTANYGFALNLTIEGALADADVDSPSHKVTMEKQKEQLHISLSGGTAIMDRDFILVVREPDNFVGEGLYAQEKDGVVALASFHPQLPKVSKSQPCCIKLVVDCSGSMSGESIDQTRAALNEILELLNLDDWFNITLFGSDHRLLFREPVPADEMHIHQAVRMLRNLNANMGGTELASALEATYASGSPEGISPDLLLITDGEVWENEELTESASRSGHRLFTVGVGSAVSESLLRMLAENSGGACELVSPNEEMAERIVRHFKRIHQPAVNNSSVHWPTEPVLQSPQVIDAVYAGDTLHLFGWLPTVPVGKARLEFELSEGIQQESVGFTRMIDSDELPGTLARMAAHSRLSSLDDKAAKALAVEYRLVTSHTSCVLVKQRDAHDKAKEIPALRKVPHRLAAGWGGMGRVDHHTVDFAVVHHSRAPMISAALEEPSLDYLDVPAFLRKQNDGSTSSSDQVVSRLNRLHFPVISRRLEIDSLSDLEQLGVDHGTIERLNKLVDEGYTEEMIVIAWLNWFIDSGEGSGVSRHVQRIVHKSEKRLGVGEELKVRIDDLMDERARFLFSDEDILF
ncbi:MAG TPA: alpha-1-antitrypsin [Gammaproteobacteria bacterium]|nr:alpha-1-antitrypsin [Gammaproteobacteria bacterium]